MSTARTSISKKTRFDVFKRDGFICQYCGAHPPEVTLEVDHIDPVCNGGDGSADNLITACFSCNRGKGGRLLTAVPKSLEERAAEIQEREAQLLGYRELIQSRLDRIEDDMWDVAATLDPQALDKGMRKDWLRSIKMFNERLDVHVVIDAAEIANAMYPRSISKAFPYFCGICWNRVRGD